MLLSEEVLADGCSIVPLVWDGLYTSRLRIRDIGRRPSYRKSSECPGIRLGVAVIARFRMVVALVELTGYALVRRGLL